MDSARYFLGNDNEEYRWKYAKGSGYVVSYITPLILLSPAPQTHSLRLKLTHRNSGEDIARFAQETVKEGFFRGEGKWALKIRPTSLDIDLVVLTFIILEKRRRDTLKSASQKDVDREETSCESGVEVGGI